jgi:uncharacterized protein YcbX
VKSLQGESLPAALVGATGMAGDRGWGVRDVASGAVLSAKREPRLLLLAAQVSGEGVAVSAAGVGAATGTAADAMVSEWLGRAVELHQAPQSAFVDEAHLHLLAVGELAGWDVRRFRPNVVVDGLPDLDRLVGERLRLGSVVVEVNKRTKRCAMPTMAQPGIDKDVSVLRSLALGRDLRLGVYARVVAPGRLDVGASVTLA